MEINILTAETILADSVFDELFSMDLFTRGKLLVALQARAKAVGCKQEFETLHKARAALERFESAEAKKIEAETRAAKKLIREQQKAEAQEQQRKMAAEMKVMQLHAMTDFQSDEYPELFCGPWICDRNGVRFIDRLTEVTACYHPILPIRRLINIESGNEKIVLAYLRDGEWRELTIDKAITGSASKIPALYPMGVSVTSETAKHLVRYLSEIEIMNGGIIPRVKSTTKMGWMQKEFVPYCGTVCFDGYGKFDRIFKAITEKGSAEKWMELALEVRQQGRIEPRMLMAASFASVLMPLFDMSSFIVDLWGDTEGGKTVSAMLATSIWANPNKDGPYITNFKGTETSAEMFCDFFNHLPFVVDDTAMIRQKLKANDLSGWIYSITQGKGKDRSNKELGLNRETNWNNVIITTGEHAITEYSTQGGALNRVLEIQCGNKEIFSDGNAVVNCILRNYGHAGHLFIDAVKSITSVKVKERQQEIYADLIKHEKMKKQSASLSALLVADEIATEYIFKDGLHIAEDEILSFLVDKEDVSENERCYEYILSEISVNSNKFKPSTEIGEIWGVNDPQKPHVTIIQNVFDRLCREGSFSSKSFLAWAKDNELLEFDDGRKNKKVSINGSKTWCVVLRKERIPGWALGAKDAEPMVLGTDEMQKP